MPARISKSPEGSVLAANDQERHARDIRGKTRPDLRKVLLERDDRGHTRKHARALFLEVLARNIPIGADLADARIRGPIVRLRQELSDEPEMDRMIGQLISYTR